jgi:hypothetical protein
MKATGPGEVAAPVGDTFRACKRIFKEHLHVTDEFRSTMVCWESGKKKEIAYKVSEERDGLCHFMF